MTDFLAEIRQVRHDGIAFDSDEHTSGISAVGTAFSDWKGDLYAVSIPAPSTRFNQDRTALARAILKLRRDIERLLAH